MRFYFNLKWCQQSQSDFTVLLVRHSFSTLQAPGLAPPHSLHLDLSRHTHLYKTLHANVVILIVQFVIILK